MTLELGGKSPNVILDDADLERAVTDGVAKCFLNSGQTCSALTRMLVPRDKLEEAEQIAASARPSRSRPATRSTTTSRLGPARVRHPARARARVHREGRGGGCPARDRRRRAARGPGSRATSCSPTVFSDVDPKMTIAQEEIFGPVLSIIPYDDEEDAVRIANDTIYGLAGGVWSADEERAPAGGRAASAPARWRSTAAPSTRSPRSAATSSPGTVASSAATASRSSSSPSRCSSEREAAGSAGCAPMPCL